MSGSQDKSADMREVGMGEEGTLLVPVTILRCYAAQKDGSRGRMMSMNRWGENVDSVPR